MGIFISKTMRVLGYTAFWLGLFALFVGFGNHKPGALVGGISSMLSSVLIIGLSYVFEAAVLYIYKNKDIKVENNKYINEYIQGEEDVIDNSGFEGEYARQFDDGEIVIYTPENIKVKIESYDGYNVYKCSSTDNPQRVQTWHFKAYVLKRVSEINKNKS